MANVLRGLFSGGKRARAYTCNDVNVTGCLPRLYSRTLMCLG